MTNSREKMTNLKIFLTMFFLYMQISKKKLRRLPNGKTSETDLKTMKHCEINQSISIVNFLTHGDVNFNVMLNYNTHYLFFFKCLSIVILHVLQFALHAGDRGSISGRDRPKSLKQVVTVPLSICQTLGIRYECHRSSEITTLLYRVSLHCSMYMSAEHRSKFVVLHR